jgi:hypothetical protein
MTRRSIAPFLLLASLPLAVSAASKGPEPITLVETSECFQLQYKAPKLEAEAKSALVKQCTECLSVVPTPGKEPEFTITLKGETQGTGKCTSKAVAVVPKRFQAPSGDAAFRCAALFEGASSECQECVGKGSAWVEWPDGKGVCAKKPAGPVLTEPAGCVWAGKQMRECSTCLFEKKKWKVDANACN